MSFAAGTRLGPYEIVAPLGAGGMGGVPRAGHAPGAHGGDQGPLLTPFGFAGGPPAARRRSRGEGSDVWAAGYQSLLGELYLVEGLK